MLVHDRHVWRLFFGGLFAFTVAAFFVWPYLPTQDPVSYFNFADQRMFLGIPNFFDVVSNLLFIYVGLWGILNVFSSIWKTRPKSSLFALFFLNLSVLLTGWGSSYFHMSPTVASLFWDRAPMAMGFMSLLLLILTERASSFVWQILLLPLMAVGVYTAWCGTTAHNDIRFYIFLQAGALLLTLVFLLFRKAQYLNNKMMYTAFICYLLAKYFETNDHKIFESLALSGHTCKHIVAAAAVVFINMAIHVPVKHRY